MSILDIPARWKIATRRSASLRMPEARTDRTYRTWPAFEKPMAARIDAGPCTLRTRWPTKDAPAALIAAVDIDGAPSGAEDELRRDGRMFLDTVIEYCARRSSVVKEPRRIPFYGPGQSGPPEEFFMGISRATR